MPEWDEMLFWDMMDPEVEARIRTAVFLGVFLLMALGEFFAPRRNGGAGRLRRWPSNFLIVVFDTLMVRLIFTATAVGFALWCQSRGWGMANQWDVPFWAAFAGALIALDLGIYFQHVLFHAIPFLWRFHRMHHTDTSFDVSTGLRFHPVEIVLSMGIKFGLIALLGTPPEAVLAFEVILNATSMFNHGNVRIPRRVDRVLRWIVVTPDMHRVHHSIHRDETNSNFGFNLPWWDRIFRTYRAQPREGHEAMLLGIDEFREPRELVIDRMLTQPFRSDRHGDR